MSAAWRPLLSGDDAARALDAARDVARAVDAAAGGADGSLCAGAAGLALLFAYLDRALPNEGYGAAAERHLARAAGVIATTRTGPDLFAGFPGIVWAMTHVGAMRHPESPDRAAAIDQALAGYVARSPWRGDYDLVIGLVGHGVYALERLSHPAAPAIAESVVARLGELAEWRDGGATWHTPARLLPPHQSELCPDGYHNLGLAHGVPGVIAVLGGLCGAGAAGERGEALLRGAVAWLLAQPEAAPEAPGFPAWLAPGQERAPARVAWCYGDLGLAAALLVAARGAGEPAWEEAALGIARRAAARPRERSGVVDAGLCHGAAGVGHVLNRIWQATGDESLGAAARAWMGHALDMREPGEGVAGYRAFAPRDGEPAWAAEAGLLTGAAGVALALLAATTDVEPRWDRMLLLSARPPA